MVVVNRCFRKRGRDDFSEWNLNPGAPPEVMLGEHSYA